jgi:hypothetical protein
LTRILSAKLYSSLSASMRQLAGMNGMEHVSKGPAGKCKEAKPAIGRIINVFAIIAYEVGPIAIRWW